MQSNAIQFGLGLGFRLVGFRPAIPTWTTVLALSRISNAPFPSSATSVKIVVWSTFFVVAVIAVEASLWLSNVDHVQDPPCFNPNPNSEPEPNPN